jgi:hypothetical protein
MAVHARECPPMSKPNIPTLAALARRAEQLQAEIDAALSRTVAGDCKNCPGIPERVLRGLRTARFCHGYCACSWLRSEAEAEIRN